MCIMSNDTKKKNKSLVAIAIIIFLLVLLTVSAYVFGAKDPFSRNLIKVVPLPAALVNSSIVTLDDYYASLGAISHINKVTVSTQVKDSVLNKLIKNSVSGQLAKRVNVQPSSADIDDAYKLMQKLSGINNLGERYGLSESQFKKLIVQPDVASTKLKIWFNSNRDLNKDAYAKLDQVQALLNGGAKFDKLAASYSDDPATAKIGGDMGFVGFQDVVPEYYNQFSQYADHAPHVAVTRFGLHLFVIEETNNSGPGGSVRYHVKQIFFKAADFQSWFDEQMQNYHIIKII